MNNIRISTKYRNTWHSGDVRRPAVQPNSWAVRYTVCRPTAERSNALHSELNKTNPGKHLRTSVGHYRRYANFGRSPTEPTRQLFIATRQTTAQRCSKVKPITGWSCHKMPANRSDHLRARLILPFHLWIKATPATRPVCRQLGVNYSLAYSSATPMTSCEGQRTVLQNIFGGRCSPNDIRTRRYGHTVI